MIMFIEPHSKSRGDSKTCMGHQEGFSHPKDCESIQHSNYWMSRKYQDDNHTYAHAKAQSMNFDEKYLNDDAIDSVGMALAVSASPEKIWNNLNGTRTPFNFMAQIPNEPWHTIFFGVLTWLFNNIWSEIRQKYKGDLQVCYVDCLYDGLEIQPKLDFQPET